LSGHEGVVSAAGAAVTDADPEDCGVVSAAGPFDEVQPATTRVIQRHMRSTHQIPELFIDPFLRGIA
jgi:DNA-binding IclR family transcriptional regulator